MITFVVLKNDCTVLPRLGAHSRQVCVCSYSRYVGTHSLCVGFCIRCMSYHKRRVGCCSLYVGCTDTLCSIAASVLYVTGTKGGIANTGKVAQALCVIL